MVSVTDDEFEKIVAWAMDSLAKQMSEVKNVGIVIQDEPTQEQRIKMELRADQTLFGLYEGIPLTRRNNNYSGVLPDKITIFKHPICAQVPNIAALREEVRHTLWHELAHHFGLDHDGIHARE